MVITCWCMEQAGIASLFRGDGHDGPELVRQLRLNEHASRQRPFSAWRRGRTACTSEMQFPGQRATRK
eukprot:1597344-Lingulodinium_polyedra.AAC.1